MGEPEVTDARERSMKQDKHIVVKPAQTNNTVRKRNTTVSFFRDRLISPGEDVQITLLC
jgi:hypothetical protein